MDVIMQVHEKVYVAVGDDTREGFMTLEWALKKWSSSVPITIVIVYVNPGISKDFVHTPFGRLPAKCVNDEKLELLKKYEEDKINKLLSKYIAFCGKVRAEVYKIEKDDDPIQKIILDLITERRITKLVMTITFMRSSSPKGTAISGSFYIHRNKPEFCDLCILCGGKLVLHKEEEGGRRQQHQQQQRILSKEEEEEEEEEGDRHLGMMVLASDKLKQKPSFKGWLGRMISHGPKTTAGNPVTWPSVSSSRSLNSSMSRKNDWDIYSNEIDEYLLQLLEERGGGDEGHVVEEHGMLLENSPMVPDLPHTTKNAGKSLECLRTKVKEARRIIQLNKDEVKSEVEKQAKATWAICLCNHRAEELEARINEEIATKIDLNKELDDHRDQISELSADIQENQNRLRSLLELKSELSNKLQVSSLAKSHAEVQLTSAASSRAELVRAIEELRKQRNVLQRRIEFCKEKDAIGMATRMGSEVSGFCYKEFSADEIRLATDGFATRRRLKFDGGGGSSGGGVYKGRINRMSVAIKLIDSDQIELQARDIFQDKVNLLLNIRHPNITSLIGICPDLRCFVFEYMHNGCLRDILFSRRKSKTLQWHQRIHIASDISSGLGFLHLAEPTPIVHGSLNPSNILLDRHFVAKIDSFELTPCYDEHDDVGADVQGFGILLLQLVSGRNWAGIDQEEVIRTMRDQKKGMDFSDLVDDSAGEWPLELVEEMVGIATKCFLSVDDQLKPTKPKPSSKAGLLMMNGVVKDLKRLKKKADELVARRDCEVVLLENGVVDLDQEESSNVPAIFVCPIYQGVMADPHVAADGFSYELEAIEEWLRMGHDTSPMTNLKLEHKYLVPNRILRSLIQDWHNKRSSTSLTNKHC